MNSTSNPLFLTVKDNLKEHDYSIHSNICMFTLG